MGKALVTRLTLMYTRATLVILVVVLIGVTVSETIAFAQETSATLPAARHDAVALINSQVRAGRTLREAAIYASGHLGRPHFYLYVIGPVRGLNTEIFDGSVVPRPILSRDLAIAFSAALYIAAATPDASSRKAPVLNGTVYVNADYFRLVDEIGATFLRLLPFMIVAIAIGYIVARNIARRALRPVLDATQALHEFAQGDFTAMRVTANAPPEIRALNAAYNAAAAQAQKAVDDRELAADNVRTFISDASHELKTPLTIIMGYVGAILEGVVTDRGDEKRILTKTLGECRRMRGTIEKLISLARLDRDPVNAAAFDVVSVAREVTDSMKPLTPQLHLQVAANGDAFAFGNAGEVREALVNIIDNARKYAPGSPIDVHVTKTADVAVIEIADAGPGMSAEDRERAFERFRRGSAHGDVEGSGLGLPIAKRAVERANGRIALSSELGRGTTVRLYLPCVAVDGVRHVEHSDEAAEPS